VSFSSPQTSDGAILPTHNILELSHSLYGMLFFFPFNDHKANFGLKLLTNLKCDDQANLVS